MAKTVTVNLLVVNPQTGAGIDVTVKEMKVSETDCEKMRRSFEKLARRVERKTAKGDEQMDVTLTVKIGSEVPLSKRAKMGLKQAKKLEITCMKELGSRIK